MDTPQNSDDTLKGEKKGKKKENSLERMRLAIEKLQLARVKMTVTFIALGFTAYKFFYARVENGKQPLVDFPNGRDIGIFLIVVGFIILLLSTIQHRKSLANLKMQYEGMHYSLSLLLSYFIMALSFSLLLTVFFRL